MKTNVRRTYPSTISYSRKSFPYPFKVLLFFGANGILALLMTRYPVLPTLHVYLTFFVGIFILLTSEKPYHLFYWLGYVIGAELVWRGLGANTFWETGKYLLIAFSALAILKYKKVLKSKYTLTVYFVLLLPSVALLPTIDRQAISFALAGPLAIMTTSILFSQISINRSQVKILLLMILAATLIFSILALVGVINAETIEFSSGSLFATSANTGPNQASSILALGAFTAIMFAILEEEQIFLRYTILLIGLGLITQMLLTFSRGGLWTLAGSLFTAGYYFLRDKRSRTTFFITSIVLLVTMYLYIVPSLNRFTSGMLTERISDTDTTGRVDIIRSDLEIFLENPIFGVGPGRSNPYHARYFRIAHAHTEFSRMIAEHGGFGILSLIILLLSLIRTIVKKTSSINRAVIASCIVWGLLFMAHSATRLAAPSFLIGLAFADFHLDEDQEPANY